MSGRRRDGGEPNPIIERIQRETGVPELADILAEGLDLTDLQSLLLEVYRRRAVRITPAHLLDRYEHDKFARPAEIAPAAIAEVERLARSLLPESYEAIELSPVCPLGTNAAIATVGQNKVMTTIRNSEVVADTTSVLALECAARRRQLLRRDPRSLERVRLAASHRIVRAQAYRSANARPHFRLLGLCVAGRDEGSFRFETQSLVDQIGFYLRLLEAAVRHGYGMSAVRVTLTDLEEGRREQVLEEHVLSPLNTLHPATRCSFDPERESGRGYYTGACFHIYASDESGTEYELVDGGFTTWTQQFLSNKKERLLISGMGIELLCSRSYALG